MKTLLETLNSGAEWLEKKGIEDARKNMQLLLCELLDFSNPMQLYMEFDRPMLEEELSPLREMLKRRGDREPLQHIIGWVEFYKRPFFTDSRALIPRPETEELVDLIVKLNLPPQATIVDIGTGSGVIGLSLAAELADSTATLTDISTDALALAEKNRSRHQLENVTLIESNLLDQTESSFDLIVSNPPYIPDSEQGKLSPEVNHDPALALYSGTDGLDLLRQLIPQAYNKLKPNGFIALEIGINQSKQIENLLADAGFSSIQTQCDLNQIPRFPIAQKIT